jgi:transcription elongation factor Elf1
MSDEAVKEGPGAKITVRAADSQRLKLRCPVCGHEGWSQARGGAGIEGFQPIVLANTSNAGTVSLAITQLFCGNCGYAVAFGPPDKGEFGIDIE